MSQQRQVKLHCQSLLGTIALIVVTGSAIAAPALANPDLEPTNFKLAQVRSRVHSPTPLNLRPRTHIPLPTQRGSRDYYRHHRDYRRSRRRRGTGGTVIIINPANSRHSNYGNYNRQGSYIRIISK
ncbi:MAG: hypothetical protein AAF652_13535 [Cyanobacteria bacterium P01_C01_bin.72]